MPTLRSVAVVASATGVRFSGVCFQNSAVAAGAKFVLSSVSGSASSARLSTASGAGLDYEAQPSGYGLEVEVTDVAGASTSASATFNQPAGLKEQAVVRVTVNDVNEAPFWQSGAYGTCSAPALSNTYTSAPATLNTTGAIYTACFYVPENSASSAAFSAAVAAASDPDSFWSLRNGVSQSLVYSLSASNNVFGASAIFAVDGASRELSVVTGGASALNALPTPALRAEALARGLRDDGDCARAAVRWCLLA